MSGNRIATWLSYLALNGVVVVFLFLINVVGAEKQGYPKADEGGNIFWCFFCLAALIVGSGNNYTVGRKLSPNPRPMNEGFWTIPEYKWFNFTGFLLKSFFTTYAGIFFACWLAVLIPGAFAQSNGVPWFVVATLQSALYLVVMNSITLGEYRRGTRTIREAAEHAQRVANHQREIDLQARVSQFEQAQITADARKRRDDVRAECDAIYALAAPEIGDRFPKQEYAEFVSKYMTDAVQRCNYKRIDLLTQHPVSEPMPPEIQANLFAKRILQSVKSAIDGHRRPRFAACVSEDRPDFSFLRETTSHFECRIRQVDRSRLSFPFGLALGEQPASVLQIDMPSFESKQLLRPSTGFPREHQQIAKVLVLHQQQHSVVLFFRDEVFPLVGNRPLRMANWIGGDATLLLRPIERPLHCHNGTVLRRVPPPLVRIDPFLNVEGLQFGDDLVRKHFDERLTVFEIPPIRPQCPMLLTPIQKRIHDRGDRNGFGACRLLRRLLHQLMVLTKRSLTLSPQIDLLAIHLDVPQITGFPEKRLRIMRHD